MSGGALPHYSNISENHTSKLDIAYTRGYYLRAFGTSTVCVPAYALSLFDQAKNADADG